MNFKKMFKRETKVIAYIVICLTLVVIGGSYAFFFQVKNNNNNQVVKAGSLVVTYGNGNTIEANADDETNCLYPKSDEDAKTGGCKFELSIENTGTLPMRYDLVIYNNGSEAPSESEVVGYEYIKHTLNKQYTNGTEKTGAVNTAKVIDELADYRDTGKKILETNIIPAGETITYGLNVWIDEQADPDISEQKVYLKIDVIGSVQEERDRVYGVKREIASTSSAWTRIENSQGLVANAQVGDTSVRNDFDNIYPWSEIRSYNYDTANNQITAWYGEEDFKFDGSNGEVLTYIPEFYYKRVQDDTYEYVYISQTEKEGYTKSEAFSVGRYTMSAEKDGENNVTGVHSKSGVLPLTNVSITDFRTYAKNLGSGFGQMDYHYFILQLLYLVEYADYDSQTKLGAGYTNSSNTEAKASGGCNVLGMHSGSLDGTDASSMIYRGIEDIYGNVWQFIDGINIKDHQAYICYDQSKYAVDTFNGDYQAIGYTNAASNGYTSKLGYDSNNTLIAFPTVVSESDNSYIPDYYWQNPGNRIVIVGGNYKHKLGSGFWNWDFDLISSTVTNDIGSRLIKIN